MNVLSRIVAGFLLAWLVISPSLVSAGDVVVIANERFPRDAVSSGYLKKVYLGEKVDEGRLKIVPLDYQDNTPLKRIFIGKVLSSTVGRYNAYWIKQVFREGKTPPHGVQDAQAMIKAVRRTKGAIGYVDSEDFKDKQGTKVLIVIK